VQIGWPVTGHPTAAVFISITIDFVLAIGAEATAHWVCITGHAEVKQLEYDSGEETGSQNWDESDPELQAREGDSGTVAIRSPMGRALSHQGWLQRFTIIGNGIHFTALFAVSIFNIVTSVADDK